MQISCHDCGAVYRIPAEKLTQAINRATCKKCGAKLMIRRDGACVDEMLEAETEVVNHEESTVIAQVPELKEFDATPPLSAEVGSEEALQHLLAGGVPKTTSSGREPRVVVGREDQPIVARPVPEPAEKAPAKVEEAPAKSKAAPAASSAPAPAAAKPAVAMPKQEAMAPQPKSAVKPAATASPKSAAAPQPAAAPKPAAAPEPVAASAMTLEEPPPVAPVKATPAPAPAVKPAVEPVRPGPMAGLDPVMPAPKQNGKGAEKGRPEARGKDRGGKSVANAQAAMKAEASRLAGTKSSSGASAPARSESQGSKSGAAAAKWNMLPSNAASSALQERAPRAVAPRPADAELVEPSIFRRSIPFLVVTLVCVLAIVLERM